MLSDFTSADKVYIACGYTDLRRGIDGLASMVQETFQLDPFTNTLFLFCGRRRDRIKALYWGNVLLFVPVFTAVSPSYHPNYKLEGVSCQSMRYAILDV